MLEQITARDNLNNAFTKVRRKKGAGGVDKMEVSELPVYLRKHRDELVQSILDGIYRPNPVRRVEIPKENGKTRGLGIPTAVDRVIQQAIAQVLVPVYEPEFVETSYGFRPRRSAHDAIRKCLEYANEGYRWTVDMDLEKFFDTVSQDKLTEILSRKIKDGRVLSLIRKYLKAGVMVGNELQKTDVGVPQGGNLSPLLANIMLKDSAHIQEFEAEWKNRKARRAGRPEVTPMYNVEDAQNVMQHFTPCDYNSVYEICPGLKVRFVDAGHLLGSSSIEMWVTEENVTKKIVFSGDIGNHNRPLIKDPQYVDSADYVVMESTYGNRLHDTPPDYAVELSKVINATFTRGGNLVIPAFSVGRTQEMLYFIRRIKTENLLPEHPNFEVYIDSPLAVEATNVFHENVSDCFDEEAMELISAGINPIKFPGLRVAVSSDESKMINFDKKPKVIISASGMCEAGRIRHHLKHNLWRSDSTVLFVGYQVPGTLGYALLNGAKKVKLFGEEIEVRASIVNLPGISGHADKNQLTEWLGAIKNKPEHVFIVHGEESTAESFANHVHETFGYDAVAPYSGDAYDLITNQKVADGSRKRVEKKAAYGMASREKTIFDRLVAAGQRLVSVIQKCQGMANKDLSKFADQINALCDKWDR